MSKSIQKVVVIGSGVMGSQIAAHIANAGVPVLLLDIVPKEGDDRNALAKAALERLLKTEPAPFMHPQNAKLIALGNVEDDFEKLKDADWIVEAVVENPKIKSDIYRRIDAVRKPGTIVSSNTSTIPLKVLLEGQSAAFAEDFFITHFFNPVRYMRLLELITGPQTRADSIALIRDFCDRKMGKGVVVCKDTPGFIANRLGTFFMQTAINATLDLGLTVEEADATAGRPMGVPKTGVFGLVDLIGLDLMPLIAKSLLATLPADDGYRAIFRDPPLFQKMIADGYTGRKGKGGFYRIAKTAAGKTKESINLQTGDYAPSVSAKLPTLEAAGKNLRALCEAPDKIGQFAWRVLSQTLAYAAALVPQIADDIVSVDAAMRLGYNWKFGPFELIDQLGAGWLATRLAGEGKTVPPLLSAAADRSFYRVADGHLEYLTTQGGYAPLQRPEGVLLLADIKRASKPVAKCGSASLWDIGDGALCLEFHSKMNTIDPEILGLINKAVEIVAGSGGCWRGLVIYNEAEHFSVGANIGLAMVALNTAMYSAMEDFVKQGQAAYHILRFAPFPTVAAPAGLTLGGGCEITLHSTAVQAHAETYMGLVEVSVGLLPCWGGCAQMLGRTFTAKKTAGGPIPPISQVFETISLAKLSKSAADAVALNLMRPTDGITMNRDRLLFDAKQRMLELAKDYKPPEPWLINLPGATGLAALNLAIESFRQIGKATPHDATVSKAVAAVLCGGEGDVLDPIAETQILELEHREFVKLVRTPETAARIEHMLETGKPLRN